MTGRIQIIINPISGCGAVRRVLPGLYQRIRQGGLELSVSETTGPGDARRLAAESCDAGCRAVVAVGGDGTVNEVVGGMTGKGVPILIVPGGTENILAKYFRTVLSADWLWSVMEGGREARLDVATANGRRFLMVSGVGFDAECVRRVALARTGHITYANYFWPIWRALWGYRHPRLWVEADGELIHEGPGMAFVGNVPRYALGLSILAKAIPDDGWLDVCAYSCNGQRALLWSALKTARGRHIGSPGVSYRKARRIRIWSDEPVGVEVDGDLGGTLPVEYAVVNSPARFLVSADWHSGIAATGERDA